MKPRAYLLLVLLLLILSIVYYVKRPMAGLDTTYSLPQIQIAADPSEIVKVEIDRSGVFLRLERLKNTWRLTEPVHHLADEEAVAQLLEDVRKFQLTAMVSSNPEKQAVFQVNERGTHIVFFKDNGAQVSLIVGKEGPHEGQTYVRLLPSDTVYIAQGITSAVVNRSLRDWREKTVYRTDPELIKAMTIRYAGNKVVVQRGGGRWTANGAIVPEQMIRSAILSVAYIQAEDFIDSSLILSSPPAVQVDLVEDGLVNLDFYDPGLRNPNYVLKSSGSPIVFVVSKTTTQSLRKIVAQFTQQPDSVRAFMAQPSQLATGPAPSPSRKPQETQPSQRQSGVGTGKGIEEEGVLIVHTVKQGETLETVARRYGLSVDQIKRWNLLKKDVVSPGMELYVFVRK